MATYKVWAGAVAVFFAALLLALGLYMTAQAAPATIFSDGFESTGPLTGWTQSANPNQWGENSVPVGVHTGNKAAVVQGSTGAQPDTITIAASTAGHGAVTLTYWYRVMAALGASDHVRAQWSPDGTTWYTAADYSNVSAGAWTSASILLPAGANDKAGFKIRFEATFNGPLDAFRLDDVSLTGEPAPSCAPGAGTSFESSTLGSVNGQDGGWSVTNSAFDQAVVTNVYGYPTFGCKSLRVSDKVTSGSFGDQIFSPSITNEAGESDALNGGLSGGTRQNHFEAQFDLGTVLKDVQPGMHLSVSPDRGDGARMSYLRFEDKADGIHVFFDDVTDPTHTTGLNVVDFNETEIATLNHTDPHTIKFDMTFVDGPDNDIVAISIDGTVVHTGTSWEDYYRYDTESQPDPSYANKSRTVDSLLFRESGDPDVDNAGMGFLLDNFDLSSDTVPGSIHITKYECSADTVVNREDNGVDGEAPKGCTLEEGAHFGYVHGTQTDAGSPWDEFGVNPVTAGGVTGADGELTLSGLAATGRYVVFETDANSNKLADSDILGMYCAGDADPNPSHNDNGDITFVHPGEVSECVVYNKAAPVVHPASPEVHIYKFVDGVMATAESADNTVFPMHTVFDSSIYGHVDTSFTLSPTGWGAGDAPYEASYVGGAPGDDYSAWEVTGEGSPVVATQGECAEGKYYLAGYKVGSSLEDAESMEGFIEGNPTFTDLLDDQYVIVYNQSCDTPPPAPECSLTTVSESSTQVNGHDAVAVTPHPAWTAQIDGATWIYDAALDGNGSSQTGSTTFTKTFSIVGTPVDATLEIAADNMYAVVVNGHELNTGTSATDLDNFSSADTWTIPAADLVPGSNTITITVNNPANNPDGGAPFGDPNPGGLLFKITLQNENCPTDGGGSGGGDTAKVHIYKYLKDGDTLTQVADDSGLAPFPMKASWDAIISGEANSGSDVDYVLGDNHGGTALKYAADTAPMETPVSKYSTYEYTGTNDSYYVLSPETECLPGKYRLVGYKSSDTSLADALEQQTLTTYPEFDNFSDDRYVVVINEDCNKVLAPKVASVTMCKLDDHGAGLPGWTLYLKGDSIEDLAVPTNTSAGINSANLLSSTTSYLATVMGTWLNQNPANPADAEYSTTDGWTTHMDGYTGYSTNILELQINNTFDPDSNWGAYNPAHTYAQSFAGTDAAANFRIFDGNGTTQEESWFNDNSGSLAVNISKGFSGITEDNGCVVLNDVPYGTYTAGELGQPGWSYVSGAGEVTVDQPTETFTIVNHKDSDEGTGGSDAAPTLTIVKHAISGNGTFNFILSGTSTTAQLVTEGGWATSTPIVLDTGSTTISELSQAGWDYNSSSCKYDNKSIGVAVAGGHEVKVDNGDNVTCTFTNTKQGTGAPQIDLSVNKTVSDNTPDEGQNIVYTITAANLSEFAATGVKVSDILPAGVSFVSASSSVGTYAGNMWTIGALFSGSSAMLEITVSVDADAAGDTISNTATVSSDQDDPTPGNNTSIATLTVNTQGGEPGAQTIVVTGNTSAGENQPGWLFNRDLTTATPFSFQAGNQDIGTGSLYVPPIANNYDGSNGTCKAGVDQTGCNKFIGELFLQTPLSTLNSISYRFNIGSTTVADADQFYMSVYTTFGDSSPTKFYDCRYDVVPSTGIVGGYTTATFDPTVSTYVLTQSGSSIHTCPAAPSGMNGVVPGSGVRAIALNVGDTSASDQGVAGYLDNVVVNTDSMVTTYDFEPVASTVPADTTTTSSGGGHSFRRSTNNGGEVLGAETGPAGECSPLLKTYMRLGGNNDATEVMLLQNFLNGEMGTSLAVTGIFDTATDAAVRAFQAKYAQEILPPWGLSGPTGWVYILTQWKINDIVCPGVAPKPGVVPFGPMGMGGAGDGSTAPGTQGGVASGVVLGDENASSSSASSTSSQSSLAAALGMDGNGSLPAWFWLLVAAIIIIGGSSWYAYNKSKQA